MKGTDTVQEGLQTGVSRRTATLGPKFVAQFLDAKTLTLHRTIPLDKMVDLTATSSGYVDLVPKGDIWLIRFGPGSVNRRDTARVRPQNVPSVF